MNTVKIHIKGNLNVLNSLSVCVVDDEGKEYDIGVCAFEISAEVGKEPKVNVEIKNAWLDVTADAEITKNSIMDQIKEHYPEFKRGT